MWSIAKLGTGMREVRRAFKFTEADSTMKQTRRVS